MLAGSIRTLILLLRQGSHDPARRLVFFLGGDGGGLGVDIFLLCADEVRSLFQCKNTVSCGRVLLALIIWGAKDRNVMGRCQYHKRQVQ